MNTIYEYYKGWLEYINYYVPSDYIIVGALFVIFALALVLLLIKTLSFDADVFFASKATIRYLKKNPTLGDDKLSDLSRKIKRFPFAVRNAWNSFVKSCSNKPSAYLGQGLIFRESLFDKFLNFLLRAVTFIAVIFVFAYSLTSAGELASNLIKPLVVLIGGVIIVTVVETYSYILKRGGYYSYAKMLRMLNVAYTIRFEKAIDKAISDLESEECEAIAFKEALRRNKSDAINANKDVVASTCRGEGVKDALNVAPICNDEEKASTTIYAEVGKTTVVNCQEKTTPIANEPSKNTNTDNNDEKVILGNRDMAKGANDSFNSDSFLPQISRVDTTNLCEVSDTGLNI